MAKSFFVYINASKSRVLYVGFTRDLLIRATQHRKGEIPGFTARYNVKRLVYYEEYVNIYEAIQREKEIKGWRREKKTALIESVNPEWRDLYDDLY
jgi:putative endonuclease